jgi:hypothetical protein
MQYGFVFLLCGIGLLYFGGRGFSSKGIALWGEKRLTGILGILVGIPLLLIGSLFLLIGAVLSFTYLSLAFSR